MPNNAPDNFWAHVDELTKRLKVVLATLIISTVAMLFLPANFDFLQDVNNYQPWVSVFLRTIRERVLSPDIKLIALSFTDPIELYVIAAFVFSLTITLPVFAYEVYKFVDPALYPHEKEEMYPFVATVTVLFIVGAVFGYFVLFPFFIVSMLPFFQAVGAELIFSLMDFYNILFFTIISTGLIFTIPAFFVLLVKYGILHTDIFRRNRKYVYVALVVLAMFISPGASPQGNLFLFLPLALLFETGIFFGRRYEKQGKVKHLNLFSANKCKFCGEELSDTSPFCPKCHRSHS